MLRGGSNKINSFAIKRINKIRELHKIKIYCLILLLIVIGAIFLLYGADIYLFSQQLNKLVNYIINPNIDKDKIKEIIFKLCNDPNFLNSILDALLDLFLGCLCYIFDKDKTVHGESTDNNTYLKAKGESKYSNNSTVHTVTGTNNNTSGSGFAETSKPEKDKQSQLESKDLSKDSY